VPDTTAIAPASHTTPTANTDETESESGISTNTADQPQIAAAPQQQERTMSDAMASPNATTETPATTPNMEGPISNNPAGSNTTTNLENPPQRYSLRSRARPQQKSGPDGTTPASITPTT
jgi:hypothetical protein